MCFESPFFLLFLPLQPGFPLPDETRRKDYLVTIYNSTRGDKYLENRKYKFVGQAVAGLKQVNEALYNIAQSNANGNDLERYLFSILNATKLGAQKAAQNVGEVYKVIKPLGVYNNRGTHDGQAAFMQIPNSNVGNILGVNISNYCFMRGGCLLFFYIFGVYHHQQKKFSLDIWGVDLRAGDLLELWYTHSGIPDDPVQITPIAGCYEDQDGNIDETTIAAQYNKEIKDLITDYNTGSGAQVRRVPIGRVWATPLHHPFQTTSNYKNMVGWDAGIRETETPFAIGRIATDPSLVYKNIEVELCPCQIEGCI